jgi:hypothetical protein
MVDLGADGDLGPHSVTSKDSAGYRGVDDERHDVRIGTVGADSSHPLLLRSPLWACQASCCFVQLPGFGEQVLECARVNRPAECGAACCRRSSCAIAQADLMRSVRGPDSSLVWKSALSPLFPGFTCRPAVR